MSAASSEGRRWDAVDPNVKRITRVARKCMFFGLAFLAVGLPFLFAFLTVPQRGDWATPDNVAILVGVLVLLVLLGAILVCVRGGVVVDRRQRTITTWRGLLVPFHKTEHPFSQAHFVSISREERYGGKRNYEVFPVRLEGAAEFVKYFETPACRIYCRASMVNTVGLGALIHTVVGVAGGSGGFRTNRSGCAA